MLRFGLRRPIGKILLDELSGCVTATEGRMHDHVAQESEVRGRAFDGVVAQGRVHLANSIGGRADEGQAGCSHGLGEVGALGEEAIARMDGVAAGVFSRGDDAVGTQVGLGRGRRTDAHRFISKARVQAVRVSV